MRAAPRPGGLAEREELRHAAAAQPKAPLRTLEVAVPQAESGAVTVAHDERARGRGLGGGVVRADLDGVDALCGVDRHEPARAGVRASAATARQRELGVHAASAQLRRRPVFTSA